MRFSLHLIAVPLVVAAAACGGGGSSSTTGPSSPSTPNTPSTPSTPATPVITNSVTVGDNFFDPANIQVTPGTTVTWSWPSGVSTHNVTFNDASSGDKAAGGVFTKNFPTAGTFNYQCTLHGGMSGTVLVKS